jgi:hypothetical protein
MDYNSCSSDSFVLSSSFHSVPNQGVGEASTTFSRENLVPTNPEKKSKWADWRNTILGVLMHPSMIIFLIMLHRGEFDFEEEDKQEEKVTRENEQEGENQ